MHDAKLQVSWPLWKLATMRTSWCHNPAEGKLTLDAGFTTVLKGGLHACALLTASGVPQRPPPSFAWQYAVAHVRVGRTELRGAAAQRQRRLLRGTRPDAATLCLQQLTKTTEAALRYSSRNNEVMGSWLYALTPGTLLAAQVSSRFLRPHVRDSVPRGAPGTAVNAKVRQ